MLPKVTKAFSIRSNVPWFFLFRLAAIQSGIVLIVLFILFGILRFQVTSSLYQEAEYQAEIWLTAAATHVDRLTDRFCETYQAPLVSPQLFSISNNQLVPICSELEIKSKEAFAFNESQGFSLDIAKALKGDGSGFGGFGGFGSQKLSLGPERWLIASLKKTDQLLVRVGFRLQNIEIQIAQFDRLGIVIVILLTAIVFGFNLVQSSDVFAPFAQLLQRTRTRNTRDTEWGDVEIEVERLLDEARQLKEIIQRKDLELTSVLENISEAILLVDKKEQVLFFNQAFVLLFESDPKSSHKRALREWIRAPELLDAIARVREEPINSALTIQLHLVSSNFSRDLKVRILRLHENQSTNVPAQRESEHYNVLMVFEDQTSNERDLELKSEWITNVSHEMRTPLTAIKGYADTLIEEIKLGRQDLLENGLVRIKSNADRLLSLIQGVFDSEMPLQKKQVLVNVPDLMNEVLDAVEFKRNLKNIVIRVNTAGFDSISTNPVYLRQALINLIDNAIEYYPEHPAHEPPDGHVPVEVSWKRLDSTLEISVTDYGHGIPDSHHSRLFDRFYRVDSGRARHQGGTGLGLAIVKSMVEQLGGNVKVENIKHQIQGRTIGVKFVVSLPL